jgi:RHS repeat-associated protein
LLHPTTFGIDPATGNVTSVTDPLQRPPTNLTYWPNGQVKTATDPLNHQTQYAYDSAGDLTTVTDPLNNSSTFAYDALGRRTSVTTPLREMSSVVYDPMSNVTSATDPANQTTSLTYDLVGHPLTLQDALGNVTTWTWTPPGQNWDVKECDAASQCTESLIDWGSGLPVSSWDKRHLFTTYTYDSFQRLTKKVFNATAVAGFKKTNITYSYDTADRLLQMVDTGGGNPNTSGNTQTFNYDLLDNLLSETAPEGTVSYSNYSWILPGTMTVAGQTQISYQYDADNEITSITQGSLAAGLNYDCDGRRANWTLPNSVGVTISTLQQGSCMPSSDGYDADSRVGQISYAANGTSLGNLTYSYDADGRITGKGGSLAAVNLPSSVSGNLYNVANQVTKWNGVSASSDLAHNLTLDPTNSAPYDWDERNQLSDASTPDYLFFYDALGRRETFDDFGVLQSYLYDGLMGVQENSNNTQTVPTQSYLTMPWGEVLADSATSGQTTTTTVPLHDLVGSTIGLVNSSGSLATSFTYEPFGAVTPSGSPSSYPYLFVGMEYDSATLLYHTLARYYSPRLQRYLSADPLGFGGGDVNVFAYAGNNPVDLIDPLGMQMPAFNGLAFAQSPPPPPPPDPEDDDNGPNDRAAYAKADSGGGIGADVSNGGGAGVEGNGPPVFGGAPLFIVGQSSNTPGALRTPGSPSLPGVGIPSDEIPENQRYTPTLDLNPPSQAISQASSPKSSRQSIYNDCLLQHREYLVEAAGCYGGSLACAISLADPLACVPTLASCSAGSYTKAYCIGQANGNNASFNRDIRPLPRPR